jgi:hypothetical protein
MRRILYHITHLIYSANGTFADSRLLLCSVICLHYFAYCKFFKRGGLSSQLRTWIMSSPDPSNNSHALLNVSGYLNCLEIASRAITHKREIQVCWGHRTLWGHTKRLRSLVKARHSIISMAIPPIPIERLVEKSMHLAKSRSDMS